MSPGRAAGVAGAAMVLAAAAFGCGFGPGPSSGGTATLTVTRDYGSERLANADDADPPSSETVMRLLDRETEVTTRYGGGFVQSINGIAGSLEGGRSFDWFFYVNGIESPVGATDAPVRGGDRIWWDYHDWTAASRAPAVVGSFPEPLAQRSADDPMPVLIECAGAGHACGETTDRLDAAGIDASVSHGIMPGGGDELRVLVGPWGALRADPAAAQLERGPATSGVFAEPQRVGGGWVFVALDQSADAVGRLSDAGLVAAVRDGEDPPTWLVTGTGAPGVERAAATLDEEDLRNRYAVASVGSRTVPLPVTGTSEAAAQ